MLADARLWRGDCGQALCACVDVNSLCPFSVQCKCMYAGRAQHSGRCQRQYMLKCVGVCAAASPTSLPPRLLPSLDL